MYFTVVIIFEQIKGYLDIKYKNKVPPLPKPTDVTKSPVFFRLYFCSKVFMF